MTPDPRLPATESPAELAAVIRSEIESSPSHRITFARFMELALYEPELGYYRGGTDRPTRTGDFLTAPETHEIFGWTVARRLEEMWAELGRSNPFRIVEYGAGSGTLAVSILEGFRRHGQADLLNSVRYTPIETNPHRLADLAARFESAGFAEQLDAGSPAPTSTSTSTAGGTASTEREPVSGVLLANEFLDALPVHRVLFRDDALHELFVSWRDGFVEVVGAASTPELEARLAEDGVSLVERQVAEICLELEKWLEEAAARVDRGFALVIDYGYEAAELYGPRHLAGTLLGYRGHRVAEDPLADPGSIDLTAHVDFTAVSRLAGRHGLRTVSQTTQSEFLVAAGLEREWQAFRESTRLDAPQYLRARSGIVRLIDPRRLGGFRVLTLQRAALDPGGSGGIR
jgi:SAM-dependent MidA family methyltransferase